MNRIGSSWTAIYSRTPPDRWGSARARTTAWGKAMAQIALEESLRAVLAADPALHLTEDPADIPWRQVLGRSPSQLLVAS